MSEATLAAQYTKPDLVQANSVADMGCHPDAETGIISPNSMGNDVAFQKLRVIGVNDAAIRWSE
jgi:hypothetical protein